MKLAQELGIPPAVHEDPKAFELVRVWIANKGQHVSLRTSVWNDPAAWGIMLSDLMHHIAESYYQEHGIKQADTLRRIKAGLDAEFALPTDKPTGE